MQSKPLKGQLASAKAEQARERKIHMEGAVGVLKHLIDHARAHLFTLTESDIESALIKAENELAACKKLLEKQGK